MMAHCRKRSGITGFKFDLCRSILDIIEILLYRRINHKLREKPNELNIYLTSQFLHKIRAYLHKIQLIYYFRKLIHVFFSIMKWKKIPVLIFIVRHQNADIVAVETAVMKQTIMDRHCYAGLYTFLQLDIHLIINPETWQKKKVNGCDPLCYESLPPCLMVECTSPVLITR